jgi:UDP-glucose 4-epimerase
MYELLEARLEPSLAEKARAVLAGKRVFMTGGAGFVGSHIADLLVDAGCAEIIIIDNMVRGRPANLTRAMARGNIRLVEGDIRDKALMASLVKGADTVFHQAALRITQCAAEPRAALEVMVDATYDLVELCLEQGVRKLVAASSASVYGMADAFPTTERCHPYNNRTLYGAAKAFNEGIYRAFADMKGLDYITMRYFNVYGTRMDIYGRYTEVMIRWMERLAAGLPPIIFGDGLQTMDMINVKDVARANILAAISPATDVALNIGSGTETSLKEVARLMSAAMGRPDLLPVHEAERAVNPVPRRLADVSAARELIGFTATYALEPGIEELVAWWRAERQIPEKVQASEIVPASEMVNAAE